jgi:hypothetical protein
VTHRQGLIASGVATPILLQAMLAAEGRTKDGGGRESPGIGFGFGFLLAGLAPQLLGRGPAAANVVTAF